MAENIMKISTDNAPKPAGHYSQAIVHGGLVFVSGQLPIVPGTGGMGMVLDSIEDQTLQTLKNVEAILQAAGSSTDKVLKVTIYIPDMDLWGKVNEVYSDFFGDHKPARAVVPTRKLHAGFKIEVEAIAAL